jgi:N-acetylmuramoyl-L-alanine amidase
VPPDCVPDAVFPEPALLRHVRRLVIDPGHGGDNLGALGVAGIREKSLSLAAARRIAAYVRGHSNVDVRLTRTDDTAIALRDRPRMANEWRADAFVSIHANAHQEALAHGMEVFFLAADSSAEAARALIEADEGTQQSAVGELAWTVGAIVNDLGLAAAHARSQVLAAALADALQQTRPVERFRGVRQAPFGVLKESTMPAVVLELGYITHESEARTLLQADTQARFGQAMLLALVQLDRALGAETKAVAVIRPAGPAAAQVLPVALPR